MGAWFWLFWGGALLLAYAYVGYPLLVWGLAQRFGRETRTGSRLPSVTLLIAAHQEADVIAARLDNALALDYPPERLEILVVADGCTDATEAIVASYAHRGVKLLRQWPRRGKASALNLGMARARGEVVVGTDANAMFRPDALRMLVRHFEDAEVALVAGVKRVIGEHGAARGEGLYWRYEHFLKRMDARFGSCMGATGEIFAIRKACYRPVPTDAIIEDFIISMGLVRDGHRVAFEPAAVSEESASPSLGDEFRRKVRIAAGGWQAVWRLRALLSPLRGRVAFQFVSHRVLRWVVTPLLLPLVFAANAVLAAQSGGFYAVLLAGQLAFYALAAAGYAAQRRGAGMRFLDPFLYFTFMNVAAIAGAWRFARNAQPVTWERSRRGPLPPADAA